MIKSMNVASWVARWAALHPEKIAIIFDGVGISYRELDLRVSQTSCWLQDVGIEKGDRVAVFLRNCVEFLELYLASARVGAVFVPLNFRLAPPELDYIITNCRPRLFVYHTEFHNRIGELDFARYRPRPAVGRVGPGPGTEDSLNYAESISAWCDHRPFLTASLGPSDPEEPHVIMYTSGTTGDPKGAVLSHRKTFFNCLNAEIFFNLSFDDVMLVTLPLFHSGGLFIMSSPSLYKGATQVIHSRFNPRETYADIEKHQVTKFLGVPTVFKELITVNPAEKTDISSLRVCAIGGEKVTPQLVEECSRSGFAVRQIMGQTETSILLWASEEELKKRPGTIGRPVFHADVRLLDTNGRAVAPGEVGEMVATGSITMTEYWRDPEGTERTVKGDWLYTGDLARQDEDGYFYLVDRVKDMYISGGENVYPAEIEKAIGQHPAVEEAAVVGVPDDRWGEVGWAFVVTSAEAQVDENELVDFCKKRLAGYKLPKRVIFCEEFPRTSLGKVRKFLLKDTV